VPKDSFSEDLIDHAKKKFMDDIGVNGRLARMCMGRLVWCVNRLRNKNTDLVIIHSGMINQLQPLDVSNNKPFNHVRKHYDAWLNKDNRISTPGGKIKRASLSVTVEWISKVWKEVPVSIIPIFFKCFLSNVEDGTQDDILWEDNAQSGEGASSSEYESATEGQLDKLSV
jgi:hypothetical protein